MLTKQIYFIGRDFLNLCLPLVSPPFVHTNALIIYYEGILLTASSTASFLCKFNILSIALCTWALISSSSGQCFLESIASQSSRSLLTAVVTKTVNTIRFSITQEYFYTDDK